MTFIWQNILSTLLKCLNLQNVPLKIRDEKKKASNKLIINDCINQ